MSFGRLLRRASSKASDLLTFNAGSAGSRPVQDGEIIFSKNNVCVHPAEPVPGLPEHHPGILWKCIIYHAVTHTNAVNTRYILRIIKKLLGCFFVFFLRHSSVFYFLNTMWWRYDAFFSHGCRKVLIYCPGQSSYSGFHEYSPLCTFPHGLRQLTIRRVMIGWWGLMHSKSKHISLCPRKCRVKVYTSTNHATSDGSYVLTVAKGANTYAVTIFTSLSWFGKLMCRKKTFSAYLFKKKLFLCLKKIWIWKIWILKT